MGSSSQFTFSWLRLEVRNPWVSQLPHFQQLTQIGRVRPLQIFADFLQYCRFWTVFHTQIHTRATGFPPFSRKRIGLFWIYFDKLILSKQHESKPFRPVGSLDLPLGPICEPETRLTSASDISWYLPIDRLQYLGDKEFQAQGTQKTLWDRKPKRSSAWAGEWLKTDSGKAWR